MAASDASLPDAHREQVDVGKQIHDAFASAGGLIKAVLRPMPTVTGDGTFVDPPKTTGILKDIEKLEPTDVETIAELAKSTIFREATNDKSYFMERMIKLASSLPLSSKHGIQLTNGLIGHLWSDLQHPPSSYLGAQHMYRQADGSCNVRLFSRSITLHVS